MKKILYSILALGFLITSCADFGDISKESYADGPSVTISVTETKDSTFTFTVTPATGTDFYSYAVVKAGTASELNPYTLLKNGYTGVVSGVLNAGTNATYTVNMRNAKGEPLGSPNTTYQIYAVASSDKGMAGVVANTSVTTTDGIIPGPKTFKAEGTAVDVTFSEAVTVGEGKVLIKYYKEWDILNTVDIDAEDFEVVIDGEVVTFDTPDAPAGAFVTVSWEEGAFVDSFGNKCKAYNSGLNMETGKFTGVNYRIAIEQIAVADSLFTAPKLGTAFDDWQKFEAVITFEFDVFRNDKAVKTGDVKVIYKNDSRAIAVNMPASLWSVSGKVLKLELPEAPIYGDNVSIVIEKDVIFDVYGNGNTKYEQEEGWLYSYGYKRDIVIGNYEMSAESYWGGPVTENIQIKADPDTKDGVILTGFYGKTTPIKGVFNGDYATISVPDEQILVKSATQEVHFCNADDEGEDIVFNVAANGDLSTGTWFGYYIYHSDGRNGWLEIATDTSLKKVAVAGAPSTSFSITPRSNSRIIRK